VIDELCHNLAAHGAIPDVTECATAVREREELLGTGTGRGAAIPHVRMDGLARPILAFGRSIVGVEWDAPDGLPVHLVFLVLTPTQEEGLQLQILAAIAHGLSDDAAREQLERADTHPELWAALDRIVHAQDLARVT
jgi:mannitol/fructose-specific phosphotransferase system IIA component (Ntr-type)